jgi:hypothetical protein
MFTSLVLATTSVTVSVPGTYVYRWTISSTGCSSSSDDIQVIYTRPQAATFNYNVSSTCPWHSSLNPPANPVPVYSGGGVAGTFSSSAGLVFVSTATGEVNLKLSTPGTYTITNTIAASGSCPVITATSNLTILAPTAFTVREVVAGTKRNYIIQDAELNTTWRGQHTYQWWYIDSKGKRIDVTEPANRWMTQGLGFPAGFLTGAVTNASLIVDVIPTAAPSCQTRRVYGKAITEGTF